MSAPSTPSGLTAKAVSGGEVALSWSPATDNVGVTSYEVLRGGVPVGTTPGYQTRFADKTARPATAYTYLVVARDAAGNRSAASAPVPVATPAATPTFVQGAAVGTSGRVGSVNVAMHQPVQVGDLLVGWFGQFDAPGQLHVSDSADGPWTRAQGETYSTGAGDVALYYTKAKATAPGGVTVTVSASSPTYLQAVVGDYWGTALAGVLEASAVGKGSGAAALSGATDTAPAGSLVFAGLLTGGAPGTVTPGRTDGVALQGRIGIASRAAVAADATAAAAGAQQGAFSLGAATDWYAGAAVFRPASDSDAIAPTTPIGVTTRAPSNSPVTLTWSPSTDNVGVAGYTVFRDGVAIGDVRPGQPSYVDGAVAPSTTYSYAVLAFDGAGNRSAASAPATMTTPPPAPSYVQSGVAASGSRVTSMTIPLPKAIRTGDLLVGWFGQYDAAGPVRVADDVNGPWTRVQGETFSSGNGDIALYSVRSAAAPHGGTVTVSAAAATYLQGAAADYGGTASPGLLLHSSVSNGTSADVESGTTPPVGAGSLVVTALITGGNPGSAAPGESVASRPAVRAATSSGSVVLADVVNGGAGAQDGRFTLSAATDWYVVCAVIAP